jgi:hypothetical protein
MLLAAAGGDGLYPTNDADALSLGGDSIIISSVRKLLSSYEDDERGRLLTLVSVAFVGESRLHAAMGETVLMVDYVS